MLVHLSNYWGWYVCAAPFIMGFIYIATAGKPNDDDDDGKQVNRTGMDISGFP